MASCGAAALSSEVATAVRALAPAAPRPRQRLVVAVFWILAILVGMLWDTGVLIIVVSLMTYDLGPCARVYGHLCVFFDRVSVKVLGPFFNYVDCFLIVERRKFFVYFV